MKKILAAVLTSLLIGLGNLDADAQLLQRAGNFVRTAFSDSTTETQAKPDRPVDSLRCMTPATPVVVDNDTLFSIYAGTGGYTVTERAEIITAAFDRLIKDKSFKGDTVHLVDSEDYVDIVCAGRVLVSISDEDALWHDTDRHTLAREYLPIIQAKIDSLHKNVTLLGFIIRGSLFLLVIVLQYLLIRLTNYLFRRLRRHIIRFRDRHIKPIFIHDYELLDKRQLGRILLLGSNLIRYIILLLQLALTVPLLFAIFPVTEKFAFNIFVYILTPVKMVVHAIIDYIPNLFIIIVIWLCIKYLIRGIHYIAKEIEHEKLKIGGFYPDWARPSFNIIRFLLYAFMVAMIYPYLPGSDSGIFQGISVFVGLIVSLGSSTVIGNIIAGLVITYMRPFKLGDRIKLNETLGNVIEKTPFVTRLRTPKNEVVTIPNSFIMSSHTVNYSASARQYGLIIHTTVTIGYDVPWRQVHQLLINAARLTPGVIDDPKPFVLETDLQDYYPCYQINAYIKDADRQAIIMTDLLQNIQDTFNEAGVEIMSPQYIATRDGNASTIPTDSTRR